MKESLLKLAELLAKNEEFAKKFSLLKSVDEQYEFAQKSVSGYTKEEFVNFLNELEKAYKLKQELSPEDIEKVSGGANVKTKAAAMAMLALSAVGSAAPMLTNASEYDSNFENYLREETENAYRGGVAGSRVAGRHDDDDDVDASANVENQGSAESSLAEQVKYQPTERKDTPESEAEAKAKARVEARAKAKARAEAKAKARDEAKAKIKALNEEMDGYEWLKGDRWWMTEAERKAESVQQGPMTEEEYYESLTDEVVGNDHVKLTFNTKIVPPGFAQEALYPLDEQLEEKQDEGWAIVGDKLFYFSTCTEGEYKIDYIIPLFYDESGKASKEDGSPITVIKIPDFVNGHPVTSMGVFALYMINEYFPDLECVILPKTLKEVSFDLCLRHNRGRLLKIYVPRGTNYRYALGDERPLQPGLHDMQPLSRKPAKYVNAFPQDSSCTIM